MLNWIHLHEIEKKDKRGVTQYDDNFFLFLIAKCYNLVETQQISTRFSSQKRKKKIPSEKEKDAKSFYSLIEN